MAALAHPLRGPQDMADDLQRLLSPDRVLLVARTRFLPKGDLAEWHVPKEPQGVRTARRQVRDQLERWALPIDPDAATIVASELVPNAIRYGKPPIALRLIKGDDTLTCEVGDGAPTAPYLRHAKSIDRTYRGPGRTHSELVT
ncbi:ATP-binding protein [Streptomyces sp. NPDC058548]|uniref:ATP-binding protein n=1 Tax=Streptomyces sp. NPDC058548 TaxID=3346545 RepID=UPI0036526A97